MAGLQGSDSAVCFHLQRIPQAKIGVNKLTIEIEINGNRLHHLRP